MPGMSRSLAARSFERVEMLSYRRRSIARGMSKDFPDAGQKVIHVNRLLVEGNGTGFGGALSVFGRILARDDYNGDTPPSGPALKPFHDLKSIPTHAHFGREIYVKDHKVGFFLSDQTDRVGAVIGRNHSVT